MAWADLFKNILLTPGKVGSQEGFSEIRLTRLWSGGEALWKEAFGDIFFYCLVIRVEMLTSKTSEDRYVRQSVCYPTVIYTDKVSAAPEELFLQLFFVASCLDCCPFLRDLAFSYIILNI